MFICNQCGAVFYAAAVEKETHSEVPFNRDEEFGICPECGSDEYEEAYKCSKCGEWIPESQNKFHMCEKCEGETLDRFDTMMEQFNEDETELIKWRGIKT